MVYPCIPPPKFDLKGWFKDVFTEPILKFSSVERNWIGIDTNLLVGYNLDQYKSDVERDDENAKGMKIAHNAWKLLRYKYLEMENDMEIKTCSNGTRSVNLKPSCGEEGYLRNKYENWSESFNMHISSGEWDMPDFSNQERLLAWRIECKNEVPPVNNCSNWKEQEECELIQSFNEFINIRSKLHEREPSEIKRMLKDNELI